jgi:DNA (cytosine-5)-methyltransferase 1
VVNDRGQFTIGSLFSGIGGLELGLEWTGGFETRWQCEIDAHARRVLDKHWPGVPCYEDVKEVYESIIPEPVDLICGGFPCQPFSSAGKRRGEKDERFLWPEFVRIVRAARPRWVVAENVPGLLSIESGRTFGRILRDLAVCGYYVEWDTISAASVGALHPRNRVFIVGRMADPDVDLPGIDPRTVQEAEGNISRAEGGRLSDGCGQILEDPHGVGGRDLDGRGGEDCLGGLDPTLGATAANAPPRSDHGPATMAGRGGIFNEPPRGFDPYWQIEPDVGRVADGVPDRVDRVKRLGNAVVPQVARYIGERILEYEGVTIYDKL